MKNRVTVTKMDGESIQKAIDSLPAGGIVYLKEGGYLIDKTIFITDDICIQGSGRDTRLTLGNDVNSNVFTNADHNKGNKNISLKDFVIDGNSDNQRRPENQKKLSFANGGYFKKIKNGHFINIATIDIYQTGFHFNNCARIRIDNFFSEKLGWSGFSTSGTDDLISVKVRIIDSGRDNMHSAIHLDGGRGAYIEATITKCTGNAIMIDSNFAPMSNVVIGKTECSKSKRGVSLSGSHNNLLSNVLIENCRLTDNETGIMVSNSRNVFISNCEILENKNEGVLLQGKLGGVNTVIQNCSFVSNKNDIIEAHSSINNYFINNNILIEAKIASDLFIDASKDQAKPQSSLGSESEVQDIYEDICSICGYEGSFELFGKSVRESYRCKNCKASLRHREQARTIITLFSKSKAKTFKDLIKEDSFRALNIYEPGIIGPLRKHFKDFPSYLESYYWDDIPLGDFRNGVMNQDLMNLTFNDDSFDLIITADIFEHVRKPFLGFREVCRVLKKGGVHVFTVPSQYPMRKKTHYRVDTSGDEDIYIDPPHYHIAGDGGKSLVYTEFGEDMFQELRDVGLETKIAHPLISNDLVQKNITFYSVKKQK